MKTCKEIRYENARSLAVDGPAKFAEVMAMSPQQANAIIGPNPKRNIGDAQARLMEELFEKEVGWLDHDHSSNEMVDKTSIRDHFPLLSNEALSLIACVIRLDDFSTPVRKLFAAHQQIIEFAEELTDAHNRKTGRDDPAKWEFLTSWERDVEGRRNAEAREAGKR